MSKLATFRLDEELWESFLAATKEEGVSASSALQDFVKWYVAGNRLTKPAEVPSSSIDSRIAALESSLESRIAALESRIAVSSTFIPQTPAVTVTPDRKTAFTPDKAMIHAMLKEEGTTPLKGDEEKLVAQQHPQLLGWL